MDVNMEIPLCENNLSSHDPGGGISQYVSCIQINGRPILPPLLTNEKRREMISWRRAAITKEQQRCSRRPSSCSSDGIAQLGPHSTPTRPASLNLRHRPNAFGLQAWGHQGTLENQLAFESDSEVEGREKVGRSALQSESSQEQLNTPGESGSTLDTPETLTGSPKNGGLPRQRSYTLISPGPALLNYLAKEEERAQSGRRTWDLRSARDAWHTQRTLLSDGDRNSDDQSPPTSNSNATQVPCTDDVPSDPSRQSIPVPSVVKEEMDSLTLMMMTLKMRHDQQRLQLEEKLRDEEETLQVIFRRKISEFMGLKRSASVAGEVVREQDWSAGGGGEGAMLRSVRSAGETRRVVRPPYLAQNGRPASADPFGSVTDIDISLREDSCALKAVPKRDDLCETWSLSSVASTLSNEPVAATYRLENKYRRSTRADFERYNRAAAKICAAVRGYLTRRLMRTEHVKALFRSFRDTIQMARTLKDAKDLHSSSDYNFMIGLSRQINSNWDAIYEVFLRTSTREQMQIIAADRVRLRTAQTRTPLDSGGRKISSATIKSLNRKQKAMSRSLTGFPRSSSFSRSCFKMSSSLSGALPSPRT